MNNIKLTFIHHPVDEDGNRVKLQIDEEVDDYAPGDSDCCDIPSYIEIYMNISRNDDHLTVSARLMVEVISDADVSDDIILEAIHEYEQIYDIEASTTEEELLQWLEDYTIDLYGADPKYEVLDHLSMSELLDPIVVSMFEDGYVDWLPYNDFEVHNHLIKFPGDIGEVSFPSTSSTMGSVKHSCKALCK